jgi:hypothetical protein
MAIHPFKDIPGSLVVNRTVATAITEAQIQHCFVQVMNHRIDGVAYHKALAEAARSGFMKPLQRIVKDMANVIQLKKSRDRGPGHEY